MKLSDPEIATKEDSQREEYLMVQRAQKDSYQFLHLYERFLNRIYYYVIARVRDSQVAEDLTSEIFLIAFGKLSHYQPNAPFSAWIFTIARNVVASHYRKKHTNCSYINDFLDLQEHDNNRSEVYREALDVMIDLGQSITQLNAYERELLRLRFAGGLTYQEIAKVLKRSPGAIKMALHRLVRKLQHEMERTE